MACQTYTTGAMPVMVMSCADYRAQKGIGAYATTAQKTQAGVDFYAGIIDQACSIAIVQLPISAPVPATPTIESIIKVSETATTETIQVSIITSQGNTTTVTLAVNGTRYNTAVMGGDSRAIMTIAGLPKGNIDHNICVT